MTKFYPVFVADDAFGLKRHMMKPYPSTNLPTQKLVFNYRLSRARRVIENTFGIAASRFRIFYKPILAGVNKVKHITKAVVVLHNFLMTENHTNDNYDYCPAAFVDNDGPNGMWKSDTTKGLIPLLVGMLKKLEIHSWTTLTMKEQSIGNWKG